MAYVCNRTSAIKLFKIYRRRKSKNRDKRRRNFITDTGIGIAPEDLKRVTELGYTGYNGRIYSKSTGIGLYLTKEILKKLNLDLKNKVRSRH